MARRFTRSQPEPKRNADKLEKKERPDVPVEAVEPTAFTLDRKHERRILSWSPEPDEGFEPEVEQPTDEPSGLEDAVRAQAEAAAERAQPAIRSRPPEQHVPQPPRAVASSPEVPVKERSDALRAPKASEPARAVPAEPVSVTSPAASEETKQAPRKRGRPRGRPRRQVHFHVDPDEELLLLAAMEKFGSQQKGLIAALQALHDNEILRDEIERLTDDNERHRELLRKAEAIFDR